MIARSSSLWCKIFNVAHYSKSIKCINTKLRILVHDNKMQLQDKGNNYKNIVLELCPFLTYFLSKMTALVPHAVLLVLLLFFWPLTLWSTITFDLHFFIAECQKGTAVSNGFCVYCDGGTYQAEAGQSSCTVCPGGGTTKTIGARSVSECICKYKVTYPLCCEIQVTSMNLLFSRMEITKYLYPITSLV